MKLSGGSAKKQKWMMKRTSKKEFSYFDWNTEMPADAFMEEVSREEKDRWYPALQKQRKKSEECIDDTWYFVYSGNRCGLWKNYEEFLKARDGDWKRGQGMSKKAATFFSLEDAKKWIQASRDEEGAHWNWPNPMPVWTAA